ncbi:phosphoesterase [Ralstonia phage RSP15]|uniref:metallo-phosphoesterase n=1 Tax=Ralstonia phage RSP15 TaxID=1785960 RepID=UPI00074D455E|nr:metallo-phosphoesterase [Ralstonia phage RSP15]BAU40049.1 phosphoesterase [Ralstonia phage RSP15]
MIKKIQPLSDLHLDTQKRPFVDILKEVLNPDADMYILAGDIVEYDEANKFLNALSGIETEKPFIWVLGNHEYFHGRAELVLENTRERIAKSGLKNLFLLENEEMFFNEETDYEFKIIGATMWTNLNTNPLAAPVVKGFMNDFRKIRGFSVDFWMENFNNSLKFIKDALLTNTGTPALVVTHHGPSFRAVPEFYRGQLTNYGYTSDLEELFHDHWAPNVWVHGHTHDPYDEVHGFTRIIRNPYGYRAYGEYLFEFDPAFMIDVKEMVAPVL